MALTRLRFSQKRSASRSVDEQDIRAAWDRVCRDKWKTAAPVVLLSADSRSLRCVTRSFAWRTELLWSAQDIVRRIRVLLPLLSPPHIQVVLDAYAAPAAR